jgi:PHD/YefM family antitoxin component YafN of YafNO toxin-antitoxin module
MPTPTFESIRSTKAPIVLTVNGEAAVVVQRCNGFQDLVDRLKAAEELGQLKRSTEKP